MAKAVISEKKNHLRRLKSFSYGIFHLKFSDRKTQVKEILPFRVKFTTIGIEGYGPGNIPPIGIAVIGINNYIL